MPAPKKERLTQAQEDFILDVFHDVPLCHAYFNHFGSKSLNVAAVSANRLLKKGKIQARLQELREKATSDRVMAIIERKERLSEIARARITDYQETGADGTYTNVGKESPNTAALSEVVSRTEYDENGSHPAVITKVKLHNPVLAIQELNRMERVYTSDVNINLDSRKLVVIVNSSRTRDLLEEISNGVPPHELPQLTQGEPDTPVNEPESVLPHTPSPIDTLNNEHDHSDLSNHYDHNDL